MSTALMNFETDIATWDCKSRSAIEEIYHRHENGTSFVDRLIDACGNPTTQRGATWLLKHHLESANHLIDHESAVRLYAAVDKLEHWEARLHILQCMDAVPVPDARKRKVEMFLRACLQSDRTFVRAWAFNGFACLAREYPDDRAEVIAMLGDAFEKEAKPSIRARLKKALRSLD